VASLCASLFLMSANPWVLAAGQPGNPAQTGQAANIAGMWESKSSQGVSTLLLNADGSGEFNGKELSWTLAQNILSLTFQGGAAFKYKVSLAGNTLTVSSPDLKEPLTFTRSGSGKSEKPAASAGLAAISSGATTAAATGPEGTWHVQKPSGTFTLVLDPGGSGKFNNDHVDWKLTQGILILRWDSGDTFMYNATLTANTLKVSGANLSEPISFGRVGTHGPSGLAAASGGNVRATGSAARGNPGGKSASASGPAGDWEAPGPNGVTHLVLGPNGEGTFGGGAIRWSYSKNALTLTGPNGTPITYNATIQGDSVTLSGGGLEAPASFRRSGGASASHGAFGSGGENASDQEIEDGDGGQDTGGLSGESQGGFGGGASNLAGSYQNQQGSSLQLNPDGTAILNGQKFRYTSDGSTLTLIGADGSLPFPYSLSGNTLTVSVQGQSVVYTRTGGAGGHGATPGSSFGGGGSHPPEIFGKWCYYSGSSTGQITSGSEQCFTLIPDGTYTYYGASDSSNQYGGTASQSSDGGTWSLSGSTLSVNSQKQGPLSYTLEKRNNKNNDPMLCIDGKCFVTPEQRAPWPY